MKWHISDVRVAMDSHRYAFPKGALVERNPSWSSKVVYPSNPGVIGDSAMLLQTLSYNAFGAMMPAGCLFVTDRRSWV